MVIYVCVIFKTTVLYVIINANSIFARNLAK